MEDIQHNAPLGEGKKLYVKLMHVGEDYYSKCAKGPILELIYSLQNGLAVGTSEAEK